MQLPKKSLQPMGNLDIFLVNIMEHSQAGNTVLHLFGEDSLGQTRQPSCLNPVEKSLGDYKIYKRGIIIRGRVIRLVLSPSF